MGKPDATYGERLEVVKFLLGNWNNGELKRGSIAAAADRFDLHRNTVSVIWQNRDDLEGKKKGRVGGKRKYDLAEVKQAMEAVPQRLRQTVRATAGQVGLPKSSFADLMKSNEIRRTTTHIKPRLTDENMMRRLDFILPFIHPRIFVLTFGINICLCPSINAE